MSAITQSTVREIISDFADEIRRRRTATAKPSKDVINFRNEMGDKVEREVWQVPITLLRFRKDNGRIASDVLDYENTNGLLDERDEDSQKMLRSFLERKDPEKTEVLKSQILHAGQKDAAIITSDGFLINGNRRKMVMDQLEMEYMKVVILPGRDDEGGAPTLLEIEKLENRYQLQSDGKSEYYGFDRALSIRRKMEIGLSLKEQIDDDPQFAGATGAQIDKAVKDVEKDYLLPLECVDRYLIQFRRENQYHTVSTGMGDPEGRWQAFKDYSNTYNSKFKNSRYLIESGVEEDEIGDIEEAAFDIIRLRNIPDMPKVHTIMRSLHKYCGNREGKKEILKIPKNVDPQLPTDEWFENGNPQKPLPRADIDAKWVAKNKRDITYHLKLASKTYESQKEKETPIGLLEAALKKLTHKDMDITAIAYPEHARARELTVKIQEKADSLETQIYRAGKKLKKLTNMNR